ncbi:RimK family alpha-L-glutamate ligase [Micromonospora fulviviridis]|uniref:RimK family alpha-L-glutamate ligase n=1 Tax=Micromonospora fulviviridis TaxID=47860 RepID=UPI0037BCB1C7
MAGPASKPGLILNGEAVSGNSELREELLAAGVEVVFRAIDELAVDIGPRGVRIRETVEGRDLADFRFVQVLTYQRPTATLLNAVADYLATKAVYACNTAGVAAPTKLFKYVRLANRGLSVPSTVYLPPQLLADAYRDLATQLELPFVMKTVTGGRGRMTHIVGSEDAFVERLRDREHARVGFLVQELVPPDGSYFVLVLGGHVSLAMRCRDGGVGDLLARSGWDEADLVDIRRLDQGARETAVQAAAAMDYDIAGVHLVRHWTTGNWRVLDVNPTPPLASGGHITDKVGAYAEYLKRQFANPEQAVGNARRR